MTFIVTVKLPKNREHDPHNKVVGSCPIKLNNTCTDVTGEHHSFLFQRTNWSAEQVKQYWSEQYHVTRVEEV